MVVTRKSWAWINAYEKARLKYSPEKSKEIANKTIKKRISTPRRTGINLRTDNKALRQLNKLIR
jgi:hypothetical protein